MTEKELERIRLIERIEKTRKSDAISWSQGWRKKWQKLDDGYNRYKVSLFRHLVEYEKGNEIDEEKITYSFDFFINFCYLSRVLR